MAKSNEAINCIVETPKGATVKYTYDHKLARIELSKVMPAGLMFPFDFGFIPGTIGEDGDPLDVVIITEADTFPGCAVKCRIVGMMKATQRERGGEKMRNDRFIAVPLVSELYADIKEAKQLPSQILAQLENFFINYNEQAGKKFKPLSITGTKAALRQISKAQRHPEPTKLIQLLLPLFDNKGKNIAKRKFAAVKEKLVKQFGGVTVYTQSPGSGIWEDAKDKLVKDSVIIFEVMAAGIDRSFWKKYRHALEKNFHQQQIVIRQTAIGLL